VAKKKRDWKEIRKNTNPESWLDMNCHFTYEVETDRAVMAEYIQPETKKVLLTIWIPKRAIRTVLINSLKKIQVSKWIVDRNNLWEKIK